MLKVSVFDFGGSGERKWEGAPFDNPVVTVVHCVENQERRERRRGVVRGDNGAGIAVGA